jgi:hypothetical protein
VDDLGDGSFLIRRGHEDPDAGPRRSRGEVSPFTAVSGQDAVWDRIMGRDLPPPVGRRTHSGLPEDEFEYDDMNTRGPDYSQPDPFDSSSPFDSSDPEEAAQAQNIADTEEMLSTWDEERDRRRRWLDGRHE